MGALPTLKSIKRRPYSVTGCDIKKKS